MCENMFTTSTLVRMHIHTRELSTLYFGWGQDLLLYIFWVTLKWVFQKRGDDFQVNFNFDLKSSINITDIGGGF